MENNIKKERKTRREKGTNQEFAYELENGTSVNYSNKEKEKTIIFSS